MQVGTAAESANFMVGLIKKTFTCMDVELLLLLDKSLARSHLGYCIQAWSSHAQRDINKLDQLQRRATKLIPEFVDRPYEESLA